MKKIISITILVIGGIGVFAIWASKMGLGENKKVSWRDSYSHKAKKPYGGLVMYEHLGDIFPLAGITVNKKRPHTYFNSTEISEDYDENIEGGDAQDFDDNTKAPNSNYIILNHDYIPSDLDWEATKGFVARGNYVFIAAEKIGENVLTDIQLMQENEVSSALLNIDAQKWDVFRNPYLASLNPIVKNDTIFSTFLRDSALSAGAVVHAGLQHSPILVEVPYGEENGRFFICTTPKLFSNYFLLKNKQEYAPIASGFLSVMNKSASASLVVWDDFYKMDNPERFSDSDKGSFMRFIMSQPSLKWGLWLTGIISALYILFEMKRRQKIIPVIPALRNSYLDFAGTIGRLYFQSKNHRNIAEKKIRFFLEYIRTRFYLQTHTLDNEFVAVLSNKTQIASQDIHDIIQKIHYTRNNSDIAEEDLLRLSNLLDEFYEKTSV